MIEKNTGFIEISRRENDDSLGVSGKRVFPWGFDGVNVQPIAVDSQGQLKISGTITGGVTTVFQGGNWNLASAATIYAVVNTSAAGQSSVVLDAGIRQIGSVTISHPITIQGFSGPTIYAVVNTAAAGQASVVLDAGTKQIGSVTVSNVVNSIVTISPRTDYFGLVSISGNVNILAEIPAGTRQIGSVTIANQPPLTAGSAFIGLATVVTGNIGGAIVTVAPRTDYIGLASISGNVVNLAGTAQMGSVTVSNIIGGIVTVAPRTDYVGLMSISGNVNIGNFSGSTIYAVVNTAAAGQASIVLDTGTRFIGLVTVANQIDVRSLLSTATLFAVVNTSAAGQASVVLDTGTRFIGIVTVANQPALVASSAFIGLATVVNGAGTAQMGSVTVSSIGIGTATIGIMRIATAANYVGLMSVNIGGTLPALVASSAFIGLATTVNGAGTQQMGSVTVSSIGPGTATIGIVRITDKAWQTAPIALNATNLSGATIFISAASKKYYITCLILSSSSIVGISLLNGPTYLAGNASVRMEFAAQSGLVNSGNTQGPILFAQATQTNFLIATDTASPVSGNVIWYEE